jgi:hypothetical protein
MQASTSQQFLLQPQMALADHTSRRHASTIGPSMMGIAGRIVGAYSPRQQGVTQRPSGSSSPGRRTTRRHLPFAGFEQQAVHAMDTQTIIIVVIIVLVVLFVLGYFGRGRMRG